MVTRGKIFLGLNVKAVPNDGWRLLNIDCKLCSVLPFIQGNINGDLQTRSSIVKWNRLKIGKEVYLALGDQLLTKQVLLEKADIDDVFGLIVELKLPRDGRNRRKTTFEMLRKEYLSYFAFNSKNKVFSAV